MGIVKGPYNWEDWITMSAYKQSIDWLRNKPEDPERKKVIRKQVNTLKEYLQREAA